MRGRIPFVLGFDVEPDPRMPDPRDPQPWRGFEQLLRALRPLRRRFGRATGLPPRFSWFLRMDPQVQVAYGSATWSVDRYGRWFDRLRAAGDAFGVHPHAIRWDGGGWVIDHGDPAFVRTSVRRSLEAFAAAFGERPLMSRMGDRFLSVDAVRALDQGGIRIDMTAEPGEPGTDTLDRSTTWTGSITDYGQTPRELHLPSGGSGRMIEMPVTSSTVPRSDRRRTAPGALPPGQPYRPLLPWHCDDAIEFWDMAEARLGEMERPYLALIARSDIPFHPPEWQRFRRVMRTFASHPIRRKIVLVTPREALDVLGVKREGRLSPVGDPPARGG
ncbi:MAG: hypothetical protein M3135_03195 [Actinomycetota bacterium]|nr:hypothetical protein [Actinomycetota bacterium]